MGWTGSLMIRSSLGEDRSFECTVKLDQRTLELANDTFAIALRSVGVSGRG